MNKWLPWILCGILIVALGATIYEIRSEESSDDTAAINPNCVKQFPLTSHLLDCSEYDDKALRLQSIDDSITQAAHLAISQGKATRVSVWVRDLNSLQVANVDELDTYDPASLLKLPLAIAFYKYSEISPTILDQQITYATPADLNEQYNFFTASTTLVVGQSYSVQELLSRMLAHSDNGAYYTLLAHIDNNFYNHVLLDLGIQIPANSHVYNFVTPKSYANMFRQLYFATYLNRTNSEHILDTLSSSTFPGIRTSVPSGDTVADKFGERSVYDQYGAPLTDELHDCGIVFKDNSPYIICVMTEGKDFNTLLSIIQDMSKLVYNSI